MPFPSEPCSALPGIVRNNNELLSRTLPQPMRSRTSWPLPRNGIAFMHKSKKRTLISKMNTLLWNRCAGARVCARHRAGVGKAQRCTRRLNDYLHQAGAPSQGANPTDHACMPTAPERRSLRSTCCHGGSSPLQTSKSNESRGLVVELIRRQPLRLDARAVQLQSEWTLDAPIADMAQMVPQCMHHIYISQCSDVARRRRIQKRRSRPTARAPVAPQLRSTRVVAGVDVAEKPQRPRVLLHAQLADPRRREAHGRGRRPGADA
jgi:hypothetical protein